MDEQPVAPSLSPHPSFTRRVPLLVLLGVLFALLLARMERMSLWIDEDFTLRNAGQPTVATVIGQTAATERRPPLSFLLFHGWGRLVGVQEWAWRWLASAWLVLAVAASARLAERVHSGSGLLAALLSTLSPFLLLYGPMIRAYSLTLLLGVALTLLLVEHRPRGYLLLGALAVWTDYVLWALVATHALYTILARKSLAPRILRLWAVGYGAIALSALPLLLSAVEQSGRAAIASDLATTPVGVALKLGYPWYAYLLGETLFPWSPWAWLGLLSAGAAALALWRPTRLLLLLFASALGPLLAIVALLTLVATDLPFVNVPSRAIVAAPLLLVLVAIGFTRLRGRIRQLALAGFLMALSASLLNLYRGESYINPIYAVPAREIAALVEREASPGSLIVADYDTLLHRYLVTRPVLETDDPATLAQLTESVPEVWLLTFGRDRTRVLEMDSALRERLTTEGWQPVATWTFVEQEATYRQLKRRLFGREPYRAKATLERWVPLVEDD
jgi:hypothetical protein